MKWSNKEDTIALIDFIISKKLDLSEYGKLKSLLPDKFIVTKKNENLKDYTDQLVDEIIDWENGNQKSSLERHITDNYIIYHNV